MGRKKKEKDGEEEEVEEVEAVEEKAEEDSGVEQRAGKRASRPTVNKWATISKI